MEQIIGSFYLERTVNGNLIGEYTNNRIIRILTESADLQQAGDEPFLGVYNSTWREIDGAVSSVLRISLETKSAGAKYILSWSLNDRVIFLGEGFLKGNTLIGHYGSI